MCRHVRLGLIAIALFTAAPTLAYAQASITGVVRDTSGAVLPGVTVETASPALIEKVRSGVTDGSGRYRIEELRPGTYSVTFTLPGFAVVRREGVQLTGTFVATVNAELQVGTLEETITVTGETPIVDVQSTVRQRVLDQEILEVLPASRAPGAMAGLMPGVTRPNQDVGGLMGDGSARGGITVRGVSDARMLISGIPNHTGIGTMHGAYNLEAYQEVLVDTGGVGAEHREGGVRMNLIPRDGGNTFSGSFLTAFANNSMAGDNFTDELKERGLGTPNSVKQLADVNPALGGPILRDKVWFHAAARYTRAFNYVPMFFNKNAGNPNAWTYEPDTSRPASDENTIRNFNVRLTWQATPRNKFAFTYDPTRICDCPRSLIATRAPEANVSNYVTEDPRNQTSAHWTAPVTSRLLLEANILRHRNLAARAHVNPYFPPGPVRMIAVQEQSTGLRYRGTSSASDNLNNTLFWRAAMSYVTGAHAFKVGFNYGSLPADRTTFSPDAPLEYRFNNGVPNRLTLFATPFRQLTNVDADHGLFVQDRWTVKRLTVTVGLRYDYFHISHPEQTVGPAEFAPTRNLVFPATDGVRWHDLSPRGGLAYDIFGDGKTALKISLNKYLAGQDGTTVFGRGMSPAERIVTSVNRSWRDANANFVPDCALLDPVANGECGAMDNLDFGSTRPGLTADPDTLRGWGKREYNWQFSTGVQRELLPRISMEVSYWRTWFGNLLVTDNRAIGPSDHDEFRITAPLDARLPDGGGYVIPGLYDIRPEKFGVPADNYLTFAKNFGKQIDHWNGVDVTINARPRPGLLLQGGTTTERRTTDNCEVVTKVDNPSPLFCRVEGTFLTQLKLLGTYTVPRVDVQVSASLQNTPGAAIAANYNAPNAVVAPSLGRNLAGGASNVTVNLVEPRTMYGERMNQLDLRISKILRAGRTRTTASLDLYNAFNSSSMLALSSAFATWQRPEAILNARFAKVVVQVSF
jgi:hypothetical protein